MREPFCIKKLEKSIKEQEESGTPSIWINPGTIENCGFGGIVGEATLFFIETIYDGQVLIVSTPNEQKSLITIIALILGIQPCFKYRDAESADQFCVEWALLPDARHLQLEETKKQGLIRELAVL